MNLWDLKRFRLNDLALAYDYKSQGTLAKPSSKAGWEIRGEMEAHLSRKEGSWGGAGTWLPLLLAGPESELIQQ